MNTENFIWTDELVKEIIKDIQIPNGGGDRVSDYDFYLNSFKQSKLAPPHTVKENKNEQCQATQVKYFTEAQYLEIWDMIFSQTGYPENHPMLKNKKSSALNEDTVAKPLIEWCGIVETVRNFKTVPDAATWLREQFEILKTDTVVEDKEFTEANMKMLFKNAVNAVRQSILENIKWDKVNECCERTIDNIRNPIQVFQSPTETPPVPESNKTDYEILTCFDNKIDVYKKGKNWHDYVPVNDTTTISTCETEKCKIRSVRRISDGEVFAVKEKVNSTWGEQVITGFFINDDNRMVVDFATCRNPFNKISKLQNPKAHITYAVNKNTFEIKETIHALDESFDWITFSSRKLAENYVNVVKDKLK